MQIGTDEDIDVDDVGDTNTKKNDGKNAQLDHVCDNLRKRLNEGIDRVMDCMRIAEDKELLAENTLSLLAQKLNGTLHVAKPHLPCESAMRTIPTSSDRNANGTEMDVEMNAQPAPTSNANGNTFNGNTNANGNSAVPGFRVDEDTGFEILQAPTVTQALDAAQQYLNVSLQGVLARHLFSDTSSSTFKLRLDVTVHCPVAICWDLSYTIATKPDEVVTLCARTPWAGILSGVSSGDGKLFVHLSVIIIPSDEEGNEGSSENCQDLGHISILTPAILLQKHALKRPLPAQITWPSETECILAESVDGSGVEEHTRSLYTDAGGIPISGVRSNVVHGATLSKILLTAPNPLLLTAYINALRLSVPDGITLRSFAPAGTGVQLLEQWLKCLRDETMEFRKAAGKHCLRGFDAEKIAELMRLQIATDEVNGRCKEAINNVP